MEDPEASFLGLIWLDARIIWTQRLEMSMSSVEQEGQPVRKSLDSAPSWRILRTTEPPSTTES